MPRFCHICGAALVSQGAFCSGCGTPVESGSAPSTKSPFRSAIRQVFTPVRPEQKGDRKWGLTLGAYIVLAILVLVLLATWSSRPDRSATTSVAVANDDHPTPPTTPRPTSHKIGEEFSVGYCTYRCNGAQWQSMIAGLGTAERPDAEFLVVDLYISNDDRTASTLQPLKLVDAHGREYDESSKGTFMPGAFDMLKQLNPGVSSRGFVVFDAPQGQYSLQVSGGFESGAHALIDLTTPKPQSDNANGQNGSDPSQPAKSETQSDASMRTEIAPALDNGTAGSGSASLPNAPIPSDPLRLLQFESGVRLVIHLASFSRQPDGSFTFRGTLLQPVVLPGGTSLDQSTKLAGSGTVNNGRVTVSLTEFTVLGANYSLRSSPGTNKAAGSGPAVELDPGKVLEVFLGSASVYEKTGSMFDVPTN